MTILPRISAVAAAGVLIRTAAWLCVPIVLYGLVAVPLGMAMPRYGASIVLFIMAAIGMTGTGMFLMEHGRLAGIPFGDGPDDDLSECIPGMIAQTCAIAVAIGGTVLGAMVAAGATAI